MKKRVSSASLALIVGLLGWGLPSLKGHQAYAVDSAVFNAGQRAAIVDIVRQALKTDPTILSDAIQALRQQAVTKQEAQGLAAVKANWAALSTAPAYAVRGNVKGAVTLVEFLDPRCTYCRHMGPLVDELLKHHHDVKLVEKVIPVLGEASELDSRAIYAAAFQGHYDEMRRQLMNETTKPTLAHIKDVALAMKLDATQLEKDMYGPAVTALLTANIAQAQAVGVQGTPTFLFGKAMIAPGALDMEQMEKFLDLARKG